MHPPSATQGSIAKRGLGGFVLASVIVHGVLLGFWRNSEGQATHTTWLAVELEPAGENPLSLDDQQDRRTAANATPHSKSNPQAEKHNADEQSKVTDAAPSRSKMQPLTALEDSNNVATSSSHSFPTTDSDSVAINDSTGVTSVANGQPLVSETTMMSLDEARERIRAKLRLELDRYFDYPPRARVRGWEGDVICRLQLNSRGDIETVKIDRSSGYALLDENATNTLQRVGNIEGAAKWLEGRSVELSLPVKYRLTIN